MKNLYPLLVICSLAFMISCSSSRTPGTKVNREGVPITSKVVLKENIPSRTINTKNISAETVVAFAETLRGVPYKYGSAVKEKGFDCSGFITYVFNHYKISVPRMSRDFTNAGKPVSSLDCKRGDIILFTGSDPNSGVVGHMGLITRNDKGVLQFIHAASGQGGGVMISTMNSYFLPRFVKIIRIFNNS